MAVGESTAVGVSAGLVEVAVKTVFVATDAGGFAPIVGLAGRLNARK